jgi:ABC-type transport system involved in multi-copper enzyme maturation permease subunit
MSDYGANYDKSGSILGARLADAVELLHLSLKLQLGKIFWAWPLLPLLWPVFYTVLQVTGVSDEAPTPQMAQNFFIGVPLYLLAIAIGMQIISSEIEQRTLEVCYTVPGGAKRIWLSKLAAGFLLLVAAALLLALYTRLVFTSYPPAVLYRVLQGGVFALVLSMAFGALFRNKMTAGMASVIVLFFTGALTGFGDGPPTRYSPFFNPMGLTQTMSAEELLYWLIQNHLGFALISVTLVILTFSRAERRELLLSDD